MSVKVGDRIKDNDPRMAERVLEVVRYLNDDRTTVICRRVGWTSYAVKVRVNRIHADGKPRRSGFTLLGQQQGSDTKSQS